MSATIAAALKKIAVTLFTNPKLLKKVLGIVLGIIIVVITPVLAIVAIFKSEPKIDTNYLQSAFVGNMSEEEKAKLKIVESTMNGINEKMTSAGFDSERVKEAQVLYVLALNEQSNQKGFTEKLVSCFTQEQTDDELIVKINGVFGTNIPPSDFTKIMSGIRSQYISVKSYTDPQTKNNLDLVAWAENARDSGWGYVYGTYGNVLTKSVLNEKAERYPEDVEVYMDFITSHWLGKRTADCVGLIKGYGWFNVDTGNIQVGTNGMPDINADDMYRTATEKGRIDTIPETPGLAVWQRGHIGIYIGDGRVIHASTTTKGIIESDIHAAGFTHWLKIPYINYKEIV